MAGKRVSIGFRTTERIRELLETQAQENGRSLSQEAEYRLERSFQDDMWLELFFRDQEFSNILRQFAGIHERLLKDFENYDPDKFAITNDRNSDLRLVMTQALQTVLTQTLVGAESYGLMKEFALLELEKTMRIEERSTANSMLPDFIYVYSKSVKALLEASEEHTAEGNIDYFSENLAQEVHFKIFCDKLEEIIPPKKHKDTELIDLRIFRNLFTILARLHINDRYRSDAHKYLIENYSDLFKIDLDNWLLKTSDD